MSSVFIDVTLYKIYVFELSMVRQSALYGYVVTSVQLQAGNRLHTFLCRRFGGEHTKDRGERENIQV